MDTCRIYIVIYFPQISSLIFLCWIGLSVAAKQQKQNPSQAAAGSQKTSSIYDSEMASTGKNSTDPQSQEG